VAAFSGTPDKWGLLLRTIDFRPRHLTCIATSAQKIVAACEDIVDIYDAVTFVFQQSLRAPEAVAKIQGSPDESTLFFAHSHSITMWDVQTGGLTHTFTTQSKIADITVSVAGDHIVCGSSDGSVKFWNVNTKVEGRGFGNGQPVVAILWLSPQTFAVATQGAVYTRAIDDGENLGYSSIPGRVWGMVHSPSDTGELLVGTLQSRKGASWNSSFLKVPWRKLERPSETLKSGQGTGRRSRLPRVPRDKPGNALETPELKPLLTQQLARPGGELLNPMVVGKVIAYITLPRGVRSLDTDFERRINDPSLLDAATSVAVSLSRNLVAQTEDSIQIFSLDVLKTSSARSNVRTSHVYPLGGKHIVCLLQSNKRLTVLDLRTLLKLSPDDNTASLGSLPTNRSPSARASFSRGLVAEFGISVVMKAWRSGTPLPEWAGAADEYVPLSGMSPDCTRIVTFYGSPRWELRVKDAKDGTILANLPLGDGDLEMGMGGGGLRCRVRLENQVSPQNKRTGAARPDTLRHNPIAIGA
jgi:WD40 repeat protein